jgi:hypothetical protein
MMDFGVIADRTQRCNRHEDLSALGRDLGYQLSIDQGTLLDRLIWAIQRRRQELDRIARSTHTLNPNRG